MPGADTEPVGAYKKRRETIMAGSMSNLRLPSDLQNRAADLWRNCASAYVLKCIDTFRNSRQISEFSH